MKVLKRDTRPFQIEGCDETFTLRELTPIEIGRFLQFLNGFESEELDINSPDALEGRTKQISEFLCWLVGGMTSEIVMENLTPNMITGIIEEAFDFCGLKAFYQGHISAE